MFFILSFTFHCPFRQWHLKPAALEVVCPLANLQTQFYKLYVKQLIQFPAKSVRATKTGWLFTHFIAPRTVRYYKNNNILSLLIKSKLGYVYTNMSIPFDQHKCTDSKNMYVKSFKSEIFACIQINKAYLWVIVELLYHPLQCLTLTIVRRNRRR